MCVLFVLSTLLRGVLPPLSAPTTAAAAAAATAVAGTGGGGGGVRGEGLHVPPTCPEHGLSSSGRPELMLGLRQKKHCTYEAGAQLWQSDLADGASQRVRSSEAGMWVGWFCHAQFEQGLVDWQRR